MTFVMYASAILSILIIVYMLIKKMDIKITLFLMGIVLMFIAMAMGKGIDVKGFESTGAVWLDPILAIASQFVSTLSSAGFIILVLGGYTAYMSYIKANDVTVSVLTKPLQGIKSAYILVPIVFLLGNLTGGLSRCSRRLDCRWNGQEEPHGNRQAHFGAHDRRCRVHVRAVHDPVFVIRAPQRSWSISGRAVFGTFAGTSGPASARMADVSCGAMDTGRPAVRFFPTCRTPRFVVIRRF